MAKLKFGLLPLLLIVIAISLAAYIVFGTSLLARIANAGREQTAQTEHVDEDVLTQLGVVKDRRLTEISGIEASVFYPDCFWVHNDSGNAPEVFLIDISGNTRIRVKLKGAKNVDWEDICLAQTSFSGVEKSFYCIADVGDNSGRRKSCQLILFEEPELELSADASQAIDLEISELTILDFTYATGPRNCEAIAFDKHTDSFILFQKGNTGQSGKQDLGIYRLAVDWKFRLKGGLAERITGLNQQMVTAAAMSRDCKSILVCTYTAAGLMKRPPIGNWLKNLQTEKFRPVAIPVQQQGEAICFSADGNSAILVSEYGKSPIWEVRLSGKNKVTSSKRKSDEP